MVNTAALWAATVFLAMACASAGYAFDRVGNDYPVIIAMVCLVLAIVFAMVGAPGR